MATVKKYPDTTDTQGWTRPLIWVGLSGIAFTATILHKIIDDHIPLGGESSVVMTPLEATSATLHAAILGGWLVALAFAARGNRTGTATTLVFTLLWAVFVNGIVAVLVAPPPSDAFPYQDIAHFASLIFGGLAAYALWQEYGRQSGSVRKSGPFVALGLIVFMLVIWSVEYAAYY